MKAWYQVFELKNSKIIVIENFLAVHHVINADVTVKNAWPGEGVRILFMEGG